MYPETVRYASIVFLFLPIITSSYYVKIGVLSPDLDPETAKKVWSMAQNYSTMISLDPIVQMTRRDLDSAAQVARTVCSLAKRGVDALVYLGDPRWNAFISSYSSRLGIPLVTAQQNNEDVAEHQVCMLPDTTQAAADYMTRYGWDRFIFLYDTDHGPDQLQQVLSVLASLDSVPRTEGFWKVDSVDQALRYLNFTHSGRFLLATSERFADEFAESRGRYNILLLTPVGTVAKTPKRGMNTLTKFSVVDGEDPVLTTLENRLKTLTSFFARGRPGKDVPDSAVLHYDTSSTLYTVFNRIASGNPAALKSRTHLDCLQFSDETSAAAEAIKQVSIEHGATGRIKFDQQGRRLDYMLHIVQSTPYKVQKIGTWSDRYGLQLLSEAATPATSPSYAAFRYRNEDTLIRAPLKVTSILIEPEVLDVPGFWYRYQDFGFCTRYQMQPFLYQNEDGTLRGFVVDFLEELSKEVQLSFNLQLVKDGYYGMLVDGQWKGMIGELVRGEAEMAVAPLTKTLQRMQVVDFSKNIMRFGLNILMKKPASEQESPSFGPFAFLTVWSPETWVVIVLIVAFFSAGGYGISRFIGVPDRVRALETKGTDNLSPCGSVWFTVGSLFCRDTGIYPRNVTHRLWSLLWWMCCLFLALLYVSMLSASFIKARSTVTTTHAKKSSQELIKQFIDTGTPVIGTIAAGSTRELFRKSEVGLYQQFGQLLQRMPEVMVPSYAEGVERVRKSNGQYAFVMESVSSSLVANTEPCDTMVTSDFLVTKTYAVTFKKNSTLKPIIDHGILSLMETGTLRNLYEKWWHSQSSSCDDPMLNILPKVYNASMTLHEVAGLFYLLIFIALLAIGVAVIEYYIKARNIRMEL